MQPDSTDWYDDERQAEGLVESSPELSPAPRRGMLLREFVVTLLQTGIIAFFLIYFVAQASVIHGLSMEPNLHTDQRVIIEKVSYHFVHPQRGNVVVVDVPDSEIPLIKRVIGLPDEMIEIRQNHVFIDGLKLNEPYLDAVWQSDYGPIRIPSDHVFVMGDNRGISRDSRDFGPVSFSQILGRAWISYWPAADVGLVR